MMQLKCSVYNCSIKSAFFVGMYINHSAIRWLVVGAATLDAIFGLGEAMNCRAPCQKLNARRSHKVA